MTRPTLTRRNFLARSTLLGCSLAASPLITPVTFASAPGEGRLVVIILRGGMDGIDVVRPYGDPDFTALRNTPLPGSEGGGHDLDGFFALHPALSDLMPLWQKAELSFVHAVSTPYRDKRSHFDGQDLLEAGTVQLAGAGRDGWLNRMLQSMPDVQADTSFALGHEDLLLLSGSAPVSSWSPDVELALSPQAIRLAEMTMRDDPAFYAALSQALSLTGADSDADPSAKGGAAMGMTAAPSRSPIHLAIADFAAGRLRADARIAAFSLNGWDTHQSQDASLSRALVRLSETILRLKAGLGSTWAKTTIVAMTEFGRTARINGTGGTDHGTAGAMVLAGGALRGGRVAGQWPGLEESMLYDRRDLKPTRDVRAVAAWLLRGQFGLDRSTLESTVFPGLDMEGDPRLLL